MTPRAVKVLPTLDDLPLNKGDPPNSAWGLWGEDDELGPLNYLTDELVLKTIKTEVQTGVRVGLNLPLDFFNPPLLGRAGFEKRIINKDPLVVNDDVITFNTQGSSQWDSMRHFAYQKEKKFYNGVTQADIHDANISNPINGLHTWSKRGIAGRGVLIDFASWAAKQGLSYESFAQYSITIDVVLKIAAEQNVTFQEGDILFLRTGYVRAYSKLSSAEKATVASVKAWIGLGQSKETTEFLWKNQFAAVASDSPGFECRPPADPQWHLHPILLAGWATPIGELFDLEHLAELCEQNKRWTFFMTSAPLNYDGAVASPPNAIAIL